MSLFSIVRRLPVTATPVGDYPITISRPAVTWNTCANAIWVTKDEWNLGRGRTSCTRLTGKFQVAHRFKINGHRQTHFFGVRLTRHHQGTARLSANVGPLVGGPAASAPSSRLRVA